MLRWQRSNRGQRGQVVDSLPDEALDSLSLLICQFGISQRAHNAIEPAVENAQLLFDFCECRNGLGKTFAHDRNKGLGFHRHPRFDQIRDPSPIRFDQQCLGFRSTLALVQVFGQLQGSLRVAARNQFPNALHRLCYSMPVSQ